MSLVDIKSRPKRQVNENKLLILLASYCVEEIKAAILRTNLDHKSEIIRSIRWKMLPGKVMIYSDHPAFYLDVGVKPHRMRYLKNKVVPLDPRDIKGATASELQKGVAFRNMGDPGPMHPGIAPLNFEGAVKKAQDRLAVALLSEYVLGIE